MMDEMRADRSGLGLVHLFASIPLLLMKGDLQAWEVSDVSRCGRDSIHLKSLHRLTYDKTTGTVSDPGGLKLCPLCVREAQAERGLSWFGLRWLGMALPIASRG